MTDYRWAGAAEGPVLVVGNSLGTDARMWRDQLPALGEKLRLLLIDHPCHGEAVAAPGFDTLDQLGRRVLRILDEAGVERAHYLGLSLGGMVGLWLAANAPERIDRLAVCCTTAYFGTPEAWRDRAATVRAHGTAAIAEQVVDRWVTADYTDRSWLVDMLSAADSEGYAACCEALATLDLRADLPSITAPTLVVAGDREPAGTSAA